MKIFLIRHGETTGDIENRYGGSYDDHLTQRGRAQLEETAPVESLGVRFPVRAGLHVGLGRLAHGSILQSIFSIKPSRHSDSVKASDSSSMKMRPTRPTAR